MPRATFTDTMRFTVLDCCNCGIPFAFNEDFERRRREDHRYFYCPNGHSQHYTGPSDAEKRARDLASKLERKEAEAEREREWRRQAEERAEKEKRRRAALKAVVTKQKKRIANGVCPVPKCKRSGFDDVMNHIATCHPDWHAADEDVEPAPAIT